MKSLLVPNSLRMTMKGGKTPIQVSLHQRIDNLRLVKYLQTRDEYRAELVIPKPLRWTDTAPAQAAQVYDLNKFSLSLPLTCISQHQTDLR